MHGPRDPRQIVICGGGVAAVEALLALRALLRVGVEVHLVAPNREFVYEPLAVAEPFDLAETHLFALAELCGEQGARLHEDALENVDAHARRVRLASGEELSYDALLVAVGAWRGEWLEGALHFGGAADVKAFRAALERLVSGDEQRMCFVAPAGLGWTLPLYELALLTASHLADAGVIGAQLTVATPELDPLAVFGPAAGGLLRNLLADRGIALRTGAQAQMLEHGSLHFDSGAPLEVEQVVALAQPEGHALAGLPCDASGFIPVDEHSRVAGLRDVYGAGDGTTFPIKQGGIAAQQADAAAEAIAAQLGDAIVPSPLRPTLRGMLLTGIAPAYLRAQLGRAAGQSFETAPNPLWWPPGKIAGRYLAPYLAGHNPLTRDHTLADLSPSSHDPASVQGMHDEARELALAFAERDGADGHFDSALQWLEVIERLDGVLPPGYLGKRDAWRRHVQS
jgi:sulfide:quinone oxidoreductase